MSEIVDAVEPWAVHEQPSRPLGYGACFCDCGPCERALERAAVEQPDLPIGVKFGLAARLVVDAGVLATHGCANADLVLHFGDGDDWVREVWVASGPEAGMSPGEAALLRLLADAELPLPEWNVEVNERGETRPGTVRRVRRGPEMVA